MGVAADSFGALQGLDHNQRVADSGNKGHWSSATLEHQGTSDDIMTTVELLRDDIGASVAGER